MTVVAVKRTLSRLGALDIFYSSRGGGDTHHSKAAKTVAAWAHLHTLALQDKKSPTKTA